MGWDSIQSRGKQSYGLGQHSIKRKTKLWAGTAFNHKENKAMGQHSIMRKTWLSSQKGKLKSFQTRKQYCLIQKTIRMLSFLTRPLKRDKTTENNYMHHVYGYSMTKESSDITMKTTNINSNNNKQTNNSHSILVG